LAALCCVQQERSEWQEKHARQVEENEKMVRARALPQCIVCVCVCMCVWVCVCVASPT
jgi:hypothetical protein